MRRGGGGGGEVSTLVLVDRCGVLAQDGTSQDTRCDGRKEAREKSERTQEPFHNLNDAKQEGNESPQNFLKPLGAPM